jgi:Flp pilus assembly protein TadD
MQTHLPLQRSAGPAGGAIRRLPLTLDVCGFLLLLVLVLFGRSAGYEFINLDDGANVYENPHVMSGLSGASLRWALTSNESANWHPLTWISHMLDCQMYGSNPAGHHRTNVVLHAATAIVLLLVLRKMTGAIWPSAFAATLFAIHPLRAESVVWVAERKDVLSGLFFVLTLAAYVHYARRPFSLTRYAMVALLFLLGLMAKPMLVSLPLVLLLLDYWPLARWKNSLGEGVGLARLLGEKVPLLFLSAGACAMTLWAQSHAAAVRPLAELSLPSRAANAACSYIAYLGQFFCPVNLAAFYPHPVDALPVWQITMSVLLLVVVSLAVIAWRRSYPYLLVGWFWYLGMLIPVIGLVQVGIQARADRYTYLPQIGIAIATTWFAADWIRRGRLPRAIVWMGAAGVIAVLGCCTWRQTDYWRDSETLWNHALACNSENDFAHNSLGNVLTKEGRFSEAIAHYRAAMAIRPLSPGSYYNLGLVFQQMGSISEAIQWYQQALEIDSHMLEAHNNLGNLLEQTQKLDEAAAHYQAALSTKPDLVESLYNLAHVRLQQQKLEEAVLHCQQALAVNPDYALAHHLLGLVYYRQGRSAEAIFQLQEACRIQPADIGAVNLLARIRANSPDAGNAAPPGTSP